METIDQKQMIYASSFEEWRKWLNDHCLIEKSVWFILFHNNNKTPSVHWHDAQQLIDIAQKTGKWVEIVS